MSLPIPRNWQGRPYIVPPDGGEAVQYTRVSTFAETLEDIAGLTQWKMHKVALGIAADPALGIEAEQANEDWKTLKAICARAMDAAGANEATEHGNRVHKLTEYVDLGWTLGEMEPAIQADIDAYKKATESVHTLAVERFMVCDELGLAGTPDRIQGARLRLPSGSEIQWQGIGDVKTGKLKLTKFAVQLAVYSRSQYYTLMDDGTAVRAEPPALDQKWALVTHVPALTAEAELYLLDIEAGWEAASKLAQDVKAWRSRKDLSIKVTLGG